MVTLIIHGLETVEELAGILKFGIKESEYNIRCDKDTIHFIRKGIKIEESGNNGSPVKNNNKPLKKGPYSDEEIQYIIKNYGKISVRKIAEHLGRSQKHVSNKIWWLKKQGKIKIFGRNPKYLCNNNYNCQNCKYGTKEKTGNSYWCEKLNRRIFPRQEAVT